ncbi:hypothetical protein U6U94_10460, partial [Cutibacterium acnes]
TQSAFKKAKSNPRDTPSQTHILTLNPQFTSAWNDFLFALFLTNQNNGPVTFGLNALASGQNPNYPQIMAGVLIACLPTVVVYIALGKYFVSGLMSGSVK